MANNEDKKKALDAAIAKLEKDFGKGPGISGDNSDRIFKSGYCTGTRRCSKRTCG